MNDRDTRYWVGSRHVGVSWKPKRKNHPWFAAFCLTFLVLSAIVGGCQHV